MIRGRILAKYSRQEFEAEVDRLQKQGLKGKKKIAKAMGVSELTLISYIKYLSANTDAEIEHKRTQSLLPKIPTEQELIRRREKAKAYQLNHYHAILKPAKLAKKKQVLMEKSEKKIEHSKSSPEAALEKFKRDQSQRKLEITIKESIDPYY